MALKTYTQLLTLLNNTIKANGVRAITGNILNAVLKDFLDSTPLIHITSSTGNRNTLDNKYKSMLVLVTSPTPVLYLCTNESGSGTWEAVTTEGLTGTAITDLLNNKVDKVTGKGLSQNDYTDTDKQIVTEIVESLHTQNTDTALATGTDNEITVQELRHILDILSQGEDGNILFFNGGSESFSSLQDTDELKIVGTKISIKTLLELASGASIQRAGGNESILLGANTVILRVGTTPTTAFSIGILSQHSSGISYGVLTEDSLGIRIASESDDVANRQDSIKVQRNESASGFTHDSGKYPVALSVRNLTIPQTIKNVGFLGGTNPKVPDESNLSVLGGKIVHDTCQDLKAATLIHNVKSSTTGTTPVDLLYDPVESNNVRAVKITVTCFIDDYSKSATWDITALISNIAGTVVLEDLVGEVTPLITTFVNPNEPTIVLAIDANQLKVTLTGITGETLNWRLRIQSI